ncbi:hypothetical protein ACUOFC_23025, partial [Escherichia sp. TWPC-MK]
LSHSLAQTFRQVIRTDHPAFVFQHPSEMILVPYFLVGAFLLKIATRPLHKAVGVGACIYGLWLLYASGPMHLLLSVVLYAPGLLVFLYARKTHTHDNVLNRQEMVLIGMLLIASVPATWMLVG